MTDLEQRPEPDPPARSPDRWGSSFFKLVQVSGLATFLYEAFVEKNDRPWLLLCSMGMMLGAIGLQALVRVISRVAGG